MRWSWSRILLSAALLAGCGAGPEPVQPLELNWQAVTPAGGSVTGLAGCDGRWYAVGAADGHPAAWTSLDARTWQPVGLRVVTWYGGQGSFRSVACRDEEVVATGSASGGVHGNPRWSTWHGGTAGLVEVASPFELYGGPAAGGVGQVVAGPGGWLIVGGRVSPTTGLPGAAAWLSRDGVTFHLVDDDPALRSTTTVYTTARDAAPRPGGGWMLVGSAGSASAPLPAAWTSADGERWQRFEVEQPGPGEVDRVVPFHRGGLLAAGGGTGWLLDTERRFDAVAGVCPGTVNALSTMRTAAGETVVGLTGGTPCVSADGVNWRGIRPPGALDTLAGNGTILLAAGESGLWMADVATTSP